VTDQNQRPIQNKRVAFEEYLHSIHEQMHPLYERGWLRALAEVPRDAPVDSATSGASVTVELAIGGGDGSIQRLVVLEASATPGFIRGTLESLSRAAPFAVPPKQLLSSDGNVYLKWQLFRDPAYACSTYFARPFVLDLK
jgi:hypothetical protein